MICILPYSDFCKTSYSLDEKTILKNLPYHYEEKPLHVVWYVSVLIQKINNENASQQFDSDIQWCTEQNMHYNPLHDKYALLLYSDEDLAFFKLSRL